MTKGKKKVGESCECDRAHLSDALICVGGAFLIFSAVAGWCGGISFTFKGDDIDKRLRNLERASYNERVATLSVPTCEWKMSTNTWSEIVDMVHKEKEKKR